MPTSSIFGRGLGLGAPTRPRWEICLIGLTLASISPSVRATRLSSWTSSAESSPVHAHTHTRARAANRHTTRRLQRWVACGSHTHTTHTQHTHTHTHTVHTLHYTVHSRTAYNQKPVIVPRGDLCRVQHPSAKHSEATVTRGRRLTALSRHPTAGTRVLANRHSSISIPSSLREFE